MQAVILALAVGLIKWYVGTGFFGRVENLVMEMVNADKTNEEKRQYVIDAIKAEYTMIKTRVIDMVIGLILTKLNGTTE